MEVLGVLAAARGGLSVSDITSLVTLDQIHPSAARNGKSATYSKSGAARSLEFVGPAEHRRYRFAHDKLLEYALADDYLSDPEYRSRITASADTGVTPTGLSQMTTLRPLRGTSSMLTRRR